MTRLAPALALLLLALPGPARAGNAVRPRTPVLHLDEACLITLDRALTPTVALTYTIPYEDPCALPHGAPTQQFFRLCRPPRPDEVLPQWLSQADLFHALLLGVTPPPVTDASFVDRHPDWSGCVAPIADPRPITCEAARAELLWDLRDMSPGTYALAAYTHHPPINLWTPRWGLFRVIDSAAGDLPPAAGFANRETFVYADQLLDLDICAAGAPGSVLDLAHARESTPDDWRPIATAVPLAGARTLVPWDPPADLGGESVLLRVEIREPGGRTFTAVAPELIHVLEVPGQAPDPPAVEPAPDICREPDQDVPALDCPDLPVVEDMPSETACDCSTSARPLPLPLLLLALLVPRTTSDRSRQRRRPPHRR